MEPSNQEFIDTPNLEIQAGMQIDSPSNITVKDKKYRKYIKITAIIVGLFMAVALIVGIFFSNPIFGDFLLAPGEKEAIATAEIMSKEYILEKYNLTSNYKDIEAQIGGNGLPSGSYGGLVYITYDDFDVTCDTVDNYCTDNKDSAKIISDYKIAVEKEIVKSFSDKTYYFETTSQRTSRAKWEIFLPNNIAYGNDINDSVNFTKITDYAGSAALTTFIYIKVDKLGTIYSDNLDGVVGDITDINKSIHVLAWLYSESQPMNDYVQWLKANPSLDTCEYDNSCSSGGDVKKYDEFNEANYLYLSTNN